MKVQKDHLLTLWGGDAYGMMETSIPLQMSQQVIIQYCR